MKTNIKLIGLSVAAVIALTACSKKDEQSAATQPEPAATTAAPAEVQVHLSHNQSMPNGQLISKKLPAVK